MTTSRSSTRHRSCAPSTPAAASTRCRSCPRWCATADNRFTVERRADKVCDTIETLRSRRIPDTVLLDDLRCDGSGHDGCQAECRFYWNATWLRRVQPGEPPPSTVDDPDATQALRDLVGPERDRGDGRRRHPLPVPGDAAARRFGGSVDVRTRSVHQRAHVGKCLVGNVRAGDGESGRGPTPPPGRTAARHPHERSLAHDACDRAAGPAAR